jgi:lactam utilization protein B
LLAFGRRFIDMKLDDLADAVVYQIGALRALRAAAPR